MSSFPTSSIDFTDLDCAMDPKMPPGEAKPDLVRGITKLADLECAKGLESIEENFPPAIEQTTELVSNAKEITHETHNDTDSGSESEFPELPSFKEIPFSPVTPKKKIQSPYTRLSTLFPPTPDTTPARRLKRRASPLDSPTRSRPFRKAVQKASSRPSFVSKKSPVFNFHELKREPVNSISAFEFDRMAEAVVQQVDWEAVSEHVASNRPEGVFKRIVATILKEKAGMLKRSEQEQSASTVELGE